MSPTTGSNDSQELLHDPLRPSTHNTNSVELTREEIQEGYDISLLSLQPRNSSSSSSNHSTLSTLAPPSSSSNVRRPTSSSSSQLYDSVPSISGNEGKRLAARKYEERAREIEEKKKQKRRVIAAVEGGGGGGGGVLSRLLGENREGRDEIGGMYEEKNEGGGESKLRIRRKKKWIWTALVGLIALVIVLAVGVGVGVSSKKKGKGNDNEVEEQTLTTPAVSWVSSFDSSSDYSSINYITITNEVIEPTTDWQETTAGAATSSSGGDWARPEATPTTEALLPTLISDGSEGIVATVEGGGDPWFGEGGGSESSETIVATPGIWR
ncbi:hypothetical protein JCM3765_006078 [Sporobolomyces pararoseus]